jgi:hypothetical protein
VNDYLRLWLSCPLLSACCCWRHYLCRSLGELNTPLAPQGFVYSKFSCAQVTATSFPLSKHTGGDDTAPAFSGLRVYLTFTWEVGLPPSLVEFSSHCHFYKLSSYWLLGVCHRSCLLHPACCDGFLLPLLWRSVCPTLFATCLFCCYCLLFSFFFFFLWVGVSLSRGLC